MVLYQIPILIFTLALVAIFIAPDEPFAFKLFFQLLPMIIILIYAFRLVPKEKRLVHWLIIAGLFLSLLGDALVHWFSLGVLAYFFAHICYTFGFFSVRSFHRLHLLFIIPIGIYVLIFSGILVSNMQGQGEKARIVLVISYLVMMAITLLTAISTRNSRAISGVLLFLVSHSILLWNQWVHSIPYVEAIVMLSYYAAQLAIAISLYSIIKRERRIVW